MQSKLEFIEAVQESEPAISAMEEAVDQLVSSDALIKLLHVILMAGNIINGV